MTDPLHLAHSILAKYGADADEPSVQLARAVIEAQRRHEEFRVKAGELLTNHMAANNSMQAQLATVTAERDVLRAEAADLRERFDIELNQQMQAMTAARDEACEIALEYAAYTRRDELTTRIAALRKVGEP